MFDKAISLGEATYECLANAHDEATFTAKLNEPGEVAYERSANT